MITDWIRVKQYQETHQDLYEKAKDSTEVLAEHVNPLCTICNVADVARSQPFDNFWHILTTHFEAQSWTNNTITEFEHYRSTIRTYEAAEEEQEKVDAGQDAFNYILRTLQTVQYKQYLEDDLEDTQYLLVNTGIYTIGYMQT